jgi:hypothetical protein
MYALLCTSISRCHKPDCCFFTPLFLSSLIMNSWKDLPTTFVDDDDDGSDLISPVLLSSVLHRRDPLQMTDDAG